MIPILLHHDHSQLVGFAEWRNGCLLVTVKERVREYGLTREQLFTVFGNCGIRVLQCRNVDEIEFVEQFEIYEWSV